MLLPGQLLLILLGPLLLEALQSHQSLWFCLILLQCFSHHTHISFLNGTRPLPYQTLYTSFISKEPISILPGLVQMASPLGSLPRCHNDSCARLPQPCAPFHKVWGALVSKGATAQAHAGARQKSQPPPWDATLSLQSQTAPPSHYTAREIGQPLPMHTHHQLQVAHALRRVLP